MSNSGLITLRHCMLRAGLPIVSQGRFEEPVGPGHAFLSVCPFVYKWSLALIARRTGRGTDVSVI